VCVADSPPRLTCLPTQDAVCNFIEQLRLLSANTLDKPKKKRHNHMLGIFRLWRETTELKQKIMRVGFSYATSLASDSPESACDFPQAACSISTP
jgi:hypothetical protein